MINEKTYEEHADSVPTETIIKALRIIAKRRDSDILFADDLTITTIALLQETIRRLEILDAKVSNSENDTKMLLEYIKRYTPHTLEQIKLKLNYEKN